MQNRQNRILELATNRHRIAVIEVFLLIAPTGRKSIFEKWWARQDSNLGPRDSLYPSVSEWSGLSHHPQPNC